MTLGRLRPNGQNGTGGGLDGGNEMATDDDAPKTNK